MFVMDVNYAPFTFSDTSGLGNLTTAHQPAYHLDCLLLALKAAVASCEEAVYGKNASVLAAAAGSNTGAGHARGQTVIRPRPWSRFP